MKALLIPILFLAACSHAFDQSGCNEGAGIKAIYEGKMPEAY